MKFHGKGHIGLIKMEAGPGKPIERIIVDPGPKRFEITNPGILYCCVKSYYNGSF